MKPQIGQIYKSKDGFLIYIILEITSNEKDLLCKIMSLNKTNKYYKQYIHMIINRSEIDVYDINIC